MKFVRITRTAIASIVLAAMFALATVGFAQSDWSTPESERAGLFLVEQFDSSGPDAWSVADHPLIYITSESYDTTENATLAEDADFVGFHLIDAYSKEVITQAYFRYDPETTVTRGPHGVDVSPDGKWAYVGWSETPAGDRETSYVAVVNMRTLKIDKLFMQESYYQGEMRRQRLHHVQSWTDVDGNDRVILQFGFGADGGPHFILDPNDDNRVVRAINYDDVHPMGHPFTTPSPDGKTVYVSMGSPEIRDMHSYAAGVAKVDLETGSVTTIMGTGHHPIGITHTADGSTSYVVDGHSSQVFRIDNETNEITGISSAGVAGPYGIALNWDESELYLVGKGEGSHNRGGVLGVIDTRIFRPARSFNQPITLGGSAASIDHAILHPDPEVNELWISNMKGWETIVLDLATRTPIAYIPTPSGGDTHSGAFVRYDADWNGLLMSDMGGPKAQEMRDIILDR